MSDVTRILSQIEQGDPQAAEKLLPLVYEELRKLAAAKLAQENPGQTLQATALVHEAYLRLVGPAGLRRDAVVGAGPESPTNSSAGSHPADGAYWDSRGHFFAAAAEAMRRILVDSARHKASLKQGGQMHRQPLDDLAVAEASDGNDLLALDEALLKLAAADPIAAQLVKLRYFAGLTMDQAAESLGMSARTAYYTWNYARAWLRSAVRANS
jgi:DNA-directed RNA polymerase specialized sigma24 family protein